MTDELEPTSNIKF